MEIIVDGRYVKPVWAVEYVLRSLIETTKKKRGNFEIKYFDPAEGHLKKKGVNFLVGLAVHLDKDVYEDLIPIRVVEDNLIYSMFGKCEDFVSWNGRQIQNITIRFCRTFDDIRRKVTEIITSAVNRGLRRLQCKRFHKGERSIRMDSSVFAH